MWLLSKRMTGRQGARGQGHGAGLKPADAGAVLPRPALFSAGIAPTVGNRRINLWDAGEIERAVAAFAHSAKGGLILTSSVGDQAPRVSTVGSRPRAVCTEPPAR